MEISLSGYKVVYGDKVLNALSLIMMRLKHPRETKRNTKNQQQTGFYKCFGY